MSRVSIDRKLASDFKCSVCGMKFSTKRSQVKHVNGHGILFNQEFLTNFIDQENETTVKNRCLRKAQISLNILKNFDDDKENALKLENLLIESKEIKSPKISLSEICQDLMDLSDLVTDM